MVQFHDKLVSTAAPLFCAKLDKFGSRKFNDEISPSHHVIQSIVRHIQHTIYGQRFAFAQVKRFDLMNDVKQRRQLTFHLQIITIIMFRCLLPLLCSTSFGSRWRKMCAQIDSFNTHSHAHTIKIVNRHHRQHDVQKHIM